MLTEAQSRAQLTRRESQNPERGIPGAGWDGGRSAALLGQLCPRASLRESTATPSRSPTNSSGAQLALNHHFLGIENNVFDFRRDRPRLDGSQINDRAQREHPSPGAQELPIEAAGRENWTSVSPGLIDPCNAYVRMPHPRQAVDHKSHDLLTDGRPGPRPTLDPSTQL